MYGEQAEEGYRGVVTGWRGLQGCSEQAEEGYRGVVSRLKRVTGV